MTATSDHAWGLCQETTDIYKRLLIPPVMSSKGHKELMGAVQSQEATEGKLLDVSHI